MTEEPDSEIKRAARKQRGRRYATGLNVVVAISLGFVLLGLVATIAQRYVQVRWDISSLRYYSLSEKTLSMLTAVDGHVDVIMLFTQDAMLQDESRRLLKEYAYAADRNEKFSLALEEVDPNRDLARARKLGEQYNIVEENVIIVIANDRHKTIASELLVEYDQAIEGTDRSGLLQIKRTKQAFRGEQVISSAIQSLMQEAQPVAYFLMGHGERDIAEASNPSGYFRVVGLMKGDNIEVRPLLLAESKSIPSDCDVLVVAGPDRRIASAERDVIRAYLKQSGRLMLLLDPATSTGLDDTLREWGVQVDHDVVVGLTLTGRELFIKDYGNHAITKGLKDIVTTFYMPRSIEPIAPESRNGSVASDKPNVTILAVSTSDGYAERNLSQTPPRFDADVDREGPISIAVAVELGGSGSIEVGLRPTQMVVFGDSDFVSNGALESGAGGNIDLFLSAINWLVDRDELLAIAPKAPIDLRLDMDDQQMTTAFILNVIALPVLVAIFGVLVWISRRR